MMSGRPSCQDRPVSYGMTPDEDVSPSGACNFTRNERLVELVNACQDELTFSKTDTHVIARCGDTIMFRLENRAVKETIDLVRSSLGSIPAWLNTLASMQDEL